MSILNDQFAGGIDPLQNHRDLGFLETRQTRYAARVVDYDAYYRPIVDGESVGDMLCASHWGPSSRPIGGWAHAWPVKGGSPVNTSKFSSTQRAQNDAKAAVRAARGGLGKGGGFVKNKDGSWSAYLQIGIGLDPGGFDTYGGTGNAGGFGLPNGYFFGIDAQFAGLGGNYELVIGDGPTGVIETQDKAARAARDAHRASDKALRSRGKGGAAPAGQFGGSFGPLGAAGSAGSAAFGPGGAFGGTGRVVTGESGAGGSMRLRPIKNSGYATDAAFGVGSVNTPAGWPSLVDGSVGIVLAGTEHTKQEPVYIHGDPRMVAVNNGADPAASSLVYDTDEQGGFDFNRKAKLHSAWRVLPPFTGANAFGPGGTLAWQLAAGERDMVAGYGSVIDTSRIGTPKRPVTTQSGPTSSSPYSIYNNAAADAANKIARMLAVAGNPGAGYYAALAAFTKSQAKVVSTANGVAKSVADAGARAGVAAGVPSLTVGLTTARSGGFIEVGHGTKDKHVLGKSGEHSINAAHISIDALFYGDDEQDAPIHFEDDPYPEVASFPLKSKVHLQYNPQKFHSPASITTLAAGGASGAGRKFRGLWEFWAEVPNTKEGGGEIPPPFVTTPDDPPPPSTGLPPPTTVSRWRERMLGTANGAFLGSGWTPVGSSSGGGGGGGGGRGANSTGGAGTGDLPTELPATAVLAKAPARGRGGIYQQVDEAEPFVRVPGLELSRVGGGLTQDKVPQSRLDVVRTRDGVTERTDQFSGFPAATAHTVLLFRPQHTSRAQRDLRNAVNAPEAIINRQMADRPMTLRAEAFGAEYGETWVKTQGAGRSRFEGGTGNGGIVFLPPELDLLDVDRASYVPTASTSYIVAHPGVYWASGYARRGSGDVKTGYRWGTDSSGILTFSSMSSVGAATTAFGANASGYLFLRESGGATLTVGAIADGEFLKRSGTGIISGTAGGGSTPTGTGFVHVTGGVQDGAAALVTEADQTLADNVTANVSTTAHGYTPKAPNTTTTFLRGDASWATAPGRKRATYYYTSGAGATHTPAAGTTSCFIRGWGPGGGGGGSDGFTSQSGSGGGGESGGYFEITWANSGAITYTVGAGGTAGTAGNNAGGAGSADTTVSGTGLSCTAKAGAGGGSMAAGTSYAGAAGGSGTTGTTGGDINVEPTAGTSGRRVGATASWGGDGGQAPMAPGGAGKGASTTDVGGTATGYGCGGGGAASQGNTDKAGGTGGGGLLIIEEYF